MIEPFIVPTDPAEREQKITEGELEIKDLKRQIAEREDPDSWYNRRERLLNLATIAAIAMLVVSSVRLAIDHWAPEEGDEQSTTSYRR